MNDDRHRVVFIKTGDALQVEQVVLRCLWQVVPLGVQGHFIEPGRDAFH